MVAFLLLACTFLPPHGSSATSVSVEELRAAFCEEWSTQPAWLLGPVVVTAPRSRDFGEDEGRFAVQDPGGGSGSGLWVEPATGVPVEDLQLAVGEELFLHVQVSGFEYDCTALRATLEPEGLYRTGERVETVPTWTSIEGHSWPGRRGELIALLDDLRIPTCPTCWGSVALGTPPLEVRGSMYQLPSVTDLELHHLVGIADTHVANTKTWDESLTIHPRGADDVQIVAAGPSCETSLAEADGWSRITDGVLRETASGTGVLVDGERELPLLPYCGTWSSDCDAPESDGPIDVTGKAYGESFDLVAAAWWCRDDAGPTVTDALSPSLTGT